MPGTKQRHNNSLGRQVTTFCALFGRVKLFGLQPALCPTLVWPVARFPAAPTDREFRHEMKYVIWTLIALLAVAHQDFWFWNDATLVFGFMPITLLYHAGISLAAGMLWFLAVRFCWPTNVDMVGDSEVSEERPT